MKKELISLAISYVEAEEWRDRNASEGNYFAADMWADKAKEFAAEAIVIIKSAKHGRTWKTAVKLFDELKTAEEI